MSVWLLFIPAFTAFLGWLLNKSLVYYLFGTAKSGQPGDAPSTILKDKQKIIAETLPAEIVNRFVSPEKINELLSKGDHFAKVKPVIEEHMDDFLRNRLKIVFPVIGMFIGDKTINDLKGHFMVELEQLFPVVMNKYAGSIIDPEEIKSLIRKEILDAEISHFIHQRFAKELRMISLWGALSGFITGLMVLLFLFLLM